MITVTTDIIPKNPYFVGEKDVLDKKAICVFVAIGFFLDQDTYFKSLKVLKPGHLYELSDDGSKVLSESPYFHWHHSPKEITFETAVREFSERFESIILKQVGGKQVILPLSGGLDSRTQAVALHHLGISTYTYSYAFDQGHDETFYGKRIAEVCNFPFEALKVPSGYLWGSIERLAAINKCYSEFTHPRQMAFVDLYSQFGDIFSLGHWGDVLFDDMGIEDSLDFDSQVQTVVEKLLKKGGQELAEALWKTWCLEGNFYDYLFERVRSLMQGIGIPDSANARIRAFKSLYWAPRWTSVNLSVFEHVHPVTLPYYDNRMCEFICTIPEQYLAGRQIQIAYIKERMPELAKLTWEAQRPFNLYTYKKYNRSPFNYPYRIVNKIKRLIEYRPFVQRNWELQFLGSKNNQALQNHIFENDKFKALIPKEVVERIYEKFINEDQVMFSHPLSMLVTLASFAKSESPKL